MKFRAMWYQGKRLFSSAWYWHVANRTPVAKDAFCVHRVHIGLHCEGCADQEIPGNYEVLAERIT